MRPSCSGEPMGPYCSLFFFFLSPLCSAEKANKQWGSPPLACHPIPVLLKWGRMRKRKRSGVGKSHNVTLFWLQDRWMKCLSCLLKDSWDFLEAHANYHWERVKLQGVFRGLRPEAPTWSLCLTIQNKFRHTNNKNPAQQNIHLCTKCSFRPLHCI